MKSVKAIFAGAALLFAGQHAMAGNHAKAIVNALDPKTMNELMDAARRQPDTALTNIIPTSANKFRFLFVWPAVNTVMTHERIGRSFAERFVLFANQQKLLVKSYCLTSRNMSFGRTEYGEEEVNVAFRDIEVRFQFGGNQPCAGRLIQAAELEPPQQSLPAIPTVTRTDPPRRPVSPEQRRRPEDELKPFLTPFPGSN